MVENPPIHLQLVTVSAMTWSGGNRIILVLSIVSSVFQAAANIRSLKLVNRSENLKLYYRGTPDQRRGQRINQRPMMALFSKAAVDRSM